MARRPETLRAESLDRGTQRWVAPEEAIIHFDGIPPHLALTFDGVDQEVAFYDRALSSDEIGKHFQDDNVG